MVDRIDGRSSKCMNADTHLDKTFTTLSGLIWLPWVGPKYLTRPTKSRLLVVGESHYAKPASPDQLARVLQDHIESVTYTREVVSESLVDGDWTTPTLTALPKLITGASDFDRERLWADTSYYNFVQRMMHYNREGGPERPAWDDYVAGWATFVDVVRLLRPSHCLFLGLAAVHSFNYAMNHTAGIEHTDIECTEYVGRAQARKASVTVDGHTTELIFVQHPGKYFSWSRWHGYLATRHAQLTNWIDEQKYTSNREA